jgi:hypothetical protein
LSVFKLTRTKTRRSPPPQTGSWGRFSNEAERNTEAEGNEDDVSNDKFFNHLDNSYHGLEEGDHAFNDLPDAETDLDNFEFLPLLNGTSEETPRTDGLNNHYVQIVHVNGIVYIIWRW